jgi:hypothetical protein
MEKLTVMQNGQSYTVTVVDVDEDAEQCGVDVDGEMNWIDVDKTKDFGDLTVGVTDAVAVHEQAQDKDICEVNIGAMELYLSDGDEIEVNGVDIDGSLVTIDQDTTGGGLWTGLTINYEVEDDINLAEGEAWTDPVFGNFKILFAGMSGDYEEMELKTAGSEDVELDFVNNDGKDVKIEWYYDAGLPAGVTRTGIAGAQITLGSDYDEMLLQVSETYTNTVDDSVEGTKLLYVTSGGEAHVLEIVSVDDGDEKVDIKDITYSKTYTDKDFTLAAGVDIISLGSLGSIELDLTDSGDAGTDVDSVVFSGPAAGVIETENQAEIVVDDSSVVIDENFDGDYQNTITTTLTWTGGPDDEIEIDTPTGATALDWVDASEDNSDTQLAATQKGSILEYDDEDSDMLTMQHKR